MKPEKNRNGFGQWSECPVDAKAAWGARAILDETGFSLVPDRQTTHGDSKTSIELAVKLNEGALKEAALECKRLQSGWTPWKDLSRIEFIKRWNKLKLNPMHLDTMKESGYLDRPEELLDDLLQEERVEREFHLEISKWEKDNTPSYCESDDDCDSDTFYWDCGECYCSVCDEYHSPQSQ